jgi:Rieske 2Fe-2S family protein
MIPSGSQLLHSPVDPAEVEDTRRPTLAANALPGRVYHDPEVFAFERAAWLRRDWLLSGRVEDAPAAGDYFVADVSGENIVVVRGDDGELRAFHNVCRHRGSRLIEEPCGRLVRFQCPYHAWIYDLRGRLRTPRHTDLLEGFDPVEYGLRPVRLDTWHGLVFLNLDTEAASLADTLGELPGHFERYRLDELRLARRMEYDVAANWKAIVENYAECYHCPGVHPLLNHLTPYDLGGYLPGEGLWAGSWMEITGENVTLSMDGTNAGRPHLPGARPEDARRVYYVWIWPNVLFSLHPDYLMIHRAVPLAPGRTTVVCDLYFHPDAIAAPDFDPSGSAEFWDLTNRQDWHVCELQQQGTASAGYTPGRYSSIEHMTHCFDALVADRYASDGRRTELERVAKQSKSRRRRKAA